MNAPADEINPAIDRILGALTDADFQLLREAAMAPESQSAGVRYFTFGESRRTHVLNFADLPADGERVPLSQAASTVDSIWLSGDDMGLLELGEALDRFFRQTGLTKAPLQTIPVRISRDTLTPAESRLLRSRFRYVWCGVEPGEFLLDPGQASV
jgi:hypothetical protein